MKIVSQVTEIVIKEDLCAIHNRITSVEFYKCWILRWKDKEKTADHNRDMLLSEA